MGVSTNLQCKFVLAPLFRPLQKVALFALQFVTSYEACLSSMPVWIRAALQKLTLSAWSLVGWEYKIVPRRALLCPVQKLTLRYDTLGRIVPYCTVPVLSTVLYPGS